MIRLIAACLLICGTITAIATASHAVAAGEDLASVVSQVDRLLEQHWKSRDIVAARPATDAELARRLSLDLLGRVPTVREFEPFLKSGDKAAAPAKTGKIDAVGDAHAGHVERLLRSAEFPLYFGGVLDEMVQGRMAGNEAFVDYLRQALATGKSWERVFREVIAGGAEGEAAKQASQFVDKRAKDIDQLTVDTARGFFGVDISCARCHDHPLVADWTQFHYYGLSAFLRTPSGNKPKGDSATSGMSDSDVKFLARNGQEQTARMMFLSGKPFEQWKAALPAPADDAARWSPRRRLVEMAVDDRHFLSRALANRLWEQFLGRGLVEPVDQLHSNNPPSVPGVLELLATDLADHGYDPRRTIRVITLSRAYRASSELGAPVPDVPPANATSPASPASPASPTNAASPGDFAAMRLKPLSPRQYAISLTLAVGDQAFDESSTSGRRLGRILQVEGLEQAERLLELEAAVGPLLPRFDPRTADFQSSAREALFVSNSDAIQRLVAADGKNLAARMAQTADDKAAVALAFAALLQRAPTDSEREWFVKHLQVAAGPAAGTAASVAAAASAAASAPASADARMQRCADVVWALATSAEFRFNH
ncbi:MAG: DUF1549 domain-containing protein [Planctomycetota bacterium]